MSVVIPISEAKGRLAELVRDSDAEPVTLMRHGHPAAVLLSARSYEALLEQLDDLEDRLSVHEREHVTIDFDKLRAEL
jgi:antitoxin StbD